MFSLSQDWQIHGYVEVTSDKTAHTIIWYWSIYGKNASNNYPRTALQNPLFSSSRQPLTTNFGFMQWPLVGYTHTRVRTDRADSWSCWNFILSQWYEGCQFKSSLSSTVTWVKISHKSCQPSSKYSFTLKSDCSLNVHLIPLSEWPIPVKPVTCCL